MNPTDDSAPTATDKPLPGFIRALVQLVLPILFWTAVIFLWNHL